MVVYTIGHSTRPLDVFTTLLREAGVTPVSARSPVSVSRDHSSMHSMVRRLTGSGSVHAQQTS